jgi:hypothetical protein
MLLKGIPFQIIILGKKENLHFVETSENYPSEFMKKFRSISCGSSCA